MARRRPPTLEAVDIKYEPSSPCLVCGEPTRSIAIRCQRCLDAAFLKEELRFAKEWLRDHKEALIELGHDKGKLVHLVCYRTPHKLAWCGAQVTQARTKRPRVKRGEFPEGVCAACYSKYVDIYV